MPAQRSLDAVVRLLVLRSFEARPQRWRKHVKKSAAAGAAVVAAAAVVAQSEAPFESVSEKRAKARIRSRIRRKRRRDHRRPLSLWSGIIFLAAAVAIPERHHRHTLFLYNYHNYVSRVR